MRAIFDCLFALLLLLNTHPPADKPRSDPPKPRVATQRANRGTPRTTAPCGGWRHLVARYDWNVDKACRILVCESKGDPNARNRRSTATGLFQILGGPTNPEANVAQAYRMWRARGWQPWVCQ